LTVLAASILITCAAQHYMGCPTLHGLPNITRAAQRNLCDFINLTIFFFLN
jgi:hypothetical protein